MVVEKRPLKAKKECKAKSGAVLNLAQLSRAAYHVHFSFVQGLSPAPHPFSMVPHFATTLDRLRAKGAT
jgi:hypothetical protein